MEQLTKEQQAEVQERIEKVQKFMEENELALLSKIEKIVINKPQTPEEPLIFGDIVVTRWFDLKYGKNTNTKTEKGSESNSGEPTE